MNTLNHVAIIMDGNGRWGLKKGRSRNYGHLQGLKTVESVIKIALKKKIPYLTLYTFSTENWRRPKGEINFLFDLIRKFIKKNLSRIIKEGIRVNVLGKREGLPKDIIKTINLVKEETNNNKKLTINLALNYGSKEEILNAFKRIIKSNKSINEKNVEINLYTQEIPNPDILIRTGGQQRLSNFLLWQLAYSEIFFVKKLWPDFRELDFLNIIKKFKKIKRNFGNI